MKRDWKGDAALLRRAFAMTHELGPGCFAWGLTSSLFDSLYPFANVYLASLLVSRLAGRNWRELMLLALLTVAVNAVCQIVSAALSRQAQIRDALLYRVCKQVPADRMMAMDYQNLESAQTHERVRLLDDMHEITGMRLSSVTHYFVRLSRWLTQSVAAAILLSGGFLRAGGGAYTLGIALGLTGLIALTMTLTLRSGRRHFALYRDMLPFKKYKWYYEREYLDAYRTGREIRVFRQQALIARDYDASLTAYGEVSRTIGRIQGRYNGASALCSVAARGAITLYVGLRALRGALDLGGIVRCVEYTRKLYEGVEGAMIDLVGLNQVLLWLRAFFAFYDAPSETYHGTLPVEKRDDNDYEIEFRDVSFRYPGAENWALRHVNWKFRVGRRLAVVGRNGSGKTTLIKLLCRLYDPTEGEITLNGIDIRKYQYEEYQRVFSVVFQDFKLFAFSLGQNVAASVEVDEQKARECLEKAGFAERLAEMPEGLATPLYKDCDERGVEISGGEAQKIALARALYKDAPFIVLDEPTAALDPVAEYEIYVRFSDIVGEKTAIYISHRLSSCRFCDEILVFDEGRVVQSGSHEALVRAPGRYQELWRAQAQYYAEGEQTAESYRCDSKSMPYAP